MPFIRFPYTDAHQLNLDWIIKKIQDLPTKLSQLINDTGFVNTQQAAAAAPVQSVNGMTGDVIVGGGGGGAVDSVNGQTGTVVLTASDVGALPDTYTAPVQSVNGQTGAVVLSIPGDTSDLTNSAGFVTAAGAAAAAPVQSVNGQTGAVVLDADDIAAEKNWTLIWTNPSPTSAFAAQALPLNLSNYNECKIICGYSTSALTAIDTVIGEIDYTVYSLMTSGLTDASPVIRRRSIFIANNQISFSEAQLKNIGSTAGSTNNSYIIPEKIYAR